MQGRHFNFFLGGAKKFLFFNATGLLKNWKKQHFICSSLMSFIVPFFLFLFFSFFFSFFFFSFFFSFFLFPWGGGGRRPPPAPLNDASVWMPAQCMCQRMLCLLRHCCAALERDSGTRTCATGYTAEVFFLKFSWIQ